MYERPSTSTTRAPSARATKNGVPPTARNARTGLFTPAGITRCAASNSAADVGAGAWVIGRGPFAGAVALGEGAPHTRVSARGSEIQRHELALTAVPGEGRGIDHPSVHHREDDVGGIGIGRFAIDQRILSIRRREVGAGLDVRVVDHGDLVALALAPPDGEEILGVDEVRGPRVPGMAHRVLGMELVLHV